MVGTLHGNINKLDLSKVRSGLEVEITTGLSEGDTILVPATGVPFS